MPRRNPHRSGEVFATPGGIPGLDCSYWEKPPPEWGVLCGFRPCRLASGYLKNPHRSGEVFARGGPGWQLYGAVGETPTGAGRCLRVAKFAGIDVDLEKPPPKRGGVCESPGDGWIYSGTRNPHRSGVCFASAQTRSEPVIPGRRNPHRSGAGFTGIFGNFHPVEKPPPKWVHRHLPPSCQCAANTIAQSWPVVAAKTKPPARARGGRLARG
jgi:hypothetical protein